MSTFRDAEIAIPWLQLSGVVIVRLTRPQQVDFCLAHVQLEARHSWTFRDFWEGHCPVGFSRLCLDTAYEGLVVFSCRGLLHSLEIPTPIKSFKVLEEDLRRLRLYSDVLRGALRLWTCGAPRLLSSLPCIALGRRCSEASLHSLAPTMESPF